MRMVRAIMRNRLALAVVVPLLLVLLPGAPAEAAEPGPGGAGGGTTVTLITGDRAPPSPGPDGRPAVAIRTARKGITFSTTYGPDGVRVLPSDVAHLVPGVLDPRLFEVSRLIRSGLDDARTASIPVIMAGPSALRAGRHLPSI